MGFSASANPFWEQQQVIRPGTDLVSETNSPGTPQRTSYTVLAPEELVWDERCV